MQTFRTAIKTGLIALLGLLFIGTAAHAAEGYQTVSTPTLFKWMNSPTKPVLVYSLNPLEFNEQHIGGSINIPFELMDGHPNMPKDKTGRIVFYCHGPG
jgi:hypothetical protein